jgi:hypothetical protein
LEVVTPLLLVLAAVLAHAASVAATWQLSVAGVNITVTYAAEAEAYTDKTYVLLPGEEAELRCRVGRGNLTIQLAAGGRTWRHTIPLNPGEVYRTELEAAPGVKLRIYAAVKITAEVRADGAEPAHLKTDVPCAVRLKIRGPARFNVTFYAAPTIGVEAAGPGVAITLIERKIAEAPMTPSLTAEVHTATPLHLAAAATAASLAAVAALMRRRRASRRSDVLQVHQLFNTAHNDVRET